MSAYELPGPARMPDDQHALYPGVERKPLAPVPPGPAAVQPTLWVGLDDDPRQALLPGLDGREPKGGV